jgi:hypothetical protein
MVCRPARPVNLLDNHPGGLQANKIGPSQSLTIKKSTTSKSPKFEYSSAIAINVRFSKMVLH